ncbi:MAG: response regulator [Acidobacteriota bacterium]
MTIWFTAKLDKQPAGAASQIGRTLPAVKVLVVDSHKANRSLVQSLLEAWGARCEDAADASATLSALHRAAALNDPFRIVLLDLDPQGIEVETLARMITGDDYLSHPRILLMSPLGAAVGAERLSAAGVSGFVRKPIAERQLHTAIERALGAADHEARPLLIGPRAPTVPRNVHILVADDDPTNRVVAKAMLSRLGYTADAVCDGVDALEALKAARFDFVLLDCEMPKLDGYQTSRRIRAGDAGPENANIPLLALTANAMQGAREKCLAAGMSDYLAKPIEQRQLSELLDRWIAASSDTTSIFDVDSLRRRLMGDRELCASVIATFLEDAPRQRAALKTQIAQGNERSAQRQVHSLKGAAATVSAVAVAASADEIEQACFAGDLRKAAARLPSLEGHLLEFQSVSSTFGRSRRNVQETTKGPV